VNEALKLLPRLAPRGVGRAALTAIAVTALDGAPIPAWAQDATWSTTPAAGNNFNDPGNWTPAEVPGSVTNTGAASFGPTTPSGASPLIFSNTTLSQFQFMSGAPSYSIGVLGPNTLELTNGGVTQNLSGNNHVIVVLTGGALNFFE
jgi:hypothetical protein